MADDLEHFRQVLLESSRGVFREPFWRQAFGAEAQGGFSCHLHRRPHEQMRHVRHARDAVAKRKPRAGLPHKELKWRECEAVSHKDGLTLDIALGALYPGSLKNLYVKQTIFLS